MREFFSQFWEMLTGIAALFAQLIHSLIQALSFAPYFGSSLIESVGYLPGILTVFATLSITLMIVNYIVGRNA